MLTGVKGAAASHSWLLTLAYDGAGYCGWQIQKNGTAVAAVLEGALKQISGKRVIAHGASRTDAGVHAEGQRVRVTLPKAWRGADLQRSLNSLLPPAIRVMALHACPEEFNPRLKARLKTYRYQFFNGPALPPFLSGTHLHLRRPLALAVMRDGAARFLGKHDFSAFRAAAGAAAQPHRTIASSEIVQPAPGVIHYRVAGPGFMHQQVRIMAGTLIEIAQGKREVETIAALLKNGGRAEAGLTAPPEGLVLESIEYADRV